jgi:sulfofructose kinase
MVTVARLGGRAEMWSAVGDDWIGGLILRGLAEDRVDASQIVRVKGCRGTHMIACIDQPTGDRCFFHATQYVHPRRPVGDLKRLRGAGCLLVDSTRPASDLRAARQARRLGVPVVADVGWWTEERPAVLKHVDYAILSEHSARSLGALSAAGSAACRPRSRSNRAAGKTARRDRELARAGPLDLRMVCQAVRDMGPPCVVITLGARGLVYLDGERFGRMKAFRVNVVDTTGAGDVFHGAFCWGLVEGLALERNLEFASAAAAMKCGQIGGRAGIPTRRQVVRFLKEHKAAWSA